VLKSGKPDMYVVEKLLQEMNANPKETYKKYISTNFASSFGSDPDIWVFEISLFE
jgi:hypothetical protein